MSMKTFFPQIFELHFIQTWVEISDYTCTLAMLQKKTVSSFVLSTFSFNFSFVKLLILLVLAR